LNPDGSLAWELTMAGQGGLFDLEERLLGLSRHAADPCQHDLDGPRGADDGVLRDEPAFQGKIIIAVGVNAAAERSPVSPAP
jgi:hypothetical protein